MAIATRAPEEAHPGAVAARHPILRNLVARAVSLAAVVAWVAVGAALVAHVHPLTVTTVAAVAMLLAAEATVAVVALTEFLSRVSAAPGEQIQRPLVPVPITAGVMVVFLAVILLSVLPHDVTGALATQLRIARVAVPVAGVGTAVADYFAGRALAVAHAAH